MLGPRCLRRLAGSHIAGLFLLAFLVLGAAYTWIAPWPGPFDELQHVSYAAALQERRGVLPQFEAQRVLEPSNLSQWTDDRRHRQVGRGLAGGAVARMHSE
jgi:hypothetical protein